MLLGSWMIRTTRPLLVGFAIVLTITLTINTIRQLSSTRRVPMSVEKLRQFTMVINNLSHAVIAAEKESIKLQNELTNIVSGLVAESKEFVPGSNALLRSIQLSPSARQAADALLKKLRRNQRNRAAQMFTEKSRSDTLPQRTS